MRGLTNEERAVLQEGPAPVTTELIQRLVARGLIAYAPCPSCGTPDCLGGSSRTADGQLALRLDALARMGAR